MGTEAERRSRVRRVVSNTGPLLHLSEANALPFLSWTGQAAKGWPVGLQPESGAGTRHHATDRHAVVGDAEGYGAAEPGIAPLARLFEDESDALRKRSDALCRRNVYTTGRM